jgi:hypothetical protein
VRDESSGHRLRVFRALAQPAVPVAIPVQLLNLLRKLEQLGIQSRALMGATDAVQGIQELDSVEIMCTKRRCRWVLLR